jgi:tetratricopeptide (TPR) repeat protein
VQDAQLVCGACGHGFSYGSPEPQKLGSLSLQRTPAPQLDAEPAIYDLPAPREAVPRPGADLPAPRASVPRPGSDLPASRDAVPRGAARGPAPVGLDADLPAARASVPRPAPSKPAGGATLGALGGDLFLGDLPPASAAIRNPAPAPSEAPLPDLDLPLPDLSPPGAPPPIDRLELGDAAPPPRPQPPARTPPPLPPMPRDLGFKLHIEGASADAAAAPSAGIAPTAALPVIEVSRAGTDVPQLAPPKPRDRPEPTEPSAQGRKRKLAVVGGALGMLVVAGGATFALLGRGSKQGSAEVLRPFAADLARDHYPAYARAADALAEAGGGEKPSPALKAAAAEVALDAVLAHRGDRGLVRKAEAWLGELGTLPDPLPPEVVRARALLAIAKGKGDASAAGTEGTPEGQLVAGLRKLMKDRDGAAARKAFDAAAAANPEQLLPRFLAARAAELAHAEDASGAYQAVLAKNPTHFGAALGLARLGAADPAGKRLERAQALTTRTDGSPGEKAEAFAIVGHAAQALGRTSEAIAAYQRAVAADAQDASANTALAELYLVDGRYADALARMQAIAGAGLTEPLAKFTMGGALVANGRTPEGLVQIEQAARLAPNDPRAAFYQGWAAEKANASDAEAAAKKYRDSLALDPGFLPASLRLAALLQRTGKAKEALQVLKDAEDAGAAPARLQMAWGEALIVANEPERAEEVFHKALATDPKLVPARLGLAAALEARGDYDGAKTELARLLADAPETPGLRERLARVCVKLGAKEEALGYLQAEASSPRVTPLVRVAVAKLALELGKLDVAGRELTKVVDDAPATPQALYTLGRLREAEGDLGKALQEYRRAVQIENGPELHLAFARALQRSGKEDDALVELDAAGRLAPARLEHGRIMLNKGDVDRAITDLQTAVQLEPGLAEAHLLLGNAHDKVGELDKAAAAWRAAAKAQPTLVEALYRIGRLEMDRGRASAALDPLRKAAAGAQPGPAWVPEIYFQLGYAELAAGSKANARAALDHYLQLAAPDAAARPEVERQVAKLAGK